MKRNRHLWIAASLTVCLILGANRIDAGTTGKIAGTVIDRSTKEPLIGANVVLVGTSMGSPTDMDGNYMIINVPPSIYSIRISMIGYKTMITEEVMVHAT